MNYKMSDSKKQIKKHKLTDERVYFKPFNYPFAYDAWLAHEQSHWLHTEVSMVEDVKQWKQRLTQSERDFLTNIFRFFTQGDIDVAGGYVKNYLPYFPQPEVRMMLLGFAAREALHVAAYSHLIETLGLPENTYNQFMEYQEMKDKHEYVLSIANQNSTKENTARHIAVFSAFTEGMQLFSSFIMLLNFPRHGLMTGMGQIVTWSIVDEAVIEGTEVLTENGWIPIEDLSLSDKIYQYDMHSKETSFVNPEKIQKVQRDHSYVFESDTIHQHVSPNHRMIVMNSDNTVGEFKAHECPSDATLILSGAKSTGDDNLTNQDMLAIDMIIAGDLPVKWIYDKIPYVSSNWAKEAVEYYLSVT
jgi:ribonucleotide reductase beta subunit family protein with ferritin-like domain